MYPVYKTDLDVRLVGTRKTSARLLLLLIIGFAPSDEFGTILHVSLVFFDSTICLKKQGAYKYYGMVTVGKKQVFNTGVSQSVFSCYTD